MKDGFLKTNYHTHTTFCDGKATAEEMIQSAIDRKFDILGFSSHSMYPFSSDWHIGAKEHNLYIQKIQELKKLYCDKLEIYTGFEADYIQGVTLPSFDAYKEFNPDYLIGAVHFVPSYQGGFFEADGNFIQTRQKIQSLFNGKEKNAVCSYFECQRKMLKDGNFTFMAHPDLIRKQNSKMNPEGPLFDENASWYKKELKNTAREIAAAGVCVEVNTGGMARGYLESPYPSPYFLELLREFNVPVTVNSDSHKPDTIDFWFPEAVDYIKKAGYKEIAFFRSGNLEFQKLQ